MFERITESESKYRHLEKMSSLELLTNINKEDKTVAEVVENQINNLTPLVDIISERLKIGGRLFYIGAGTSGRLGILDASECPPTYGVPYGMVIGIIAGGNKAITEAVEFAEDDTEQGWKDLKEYGINNSDIVVGIAASGTTPYVIGALKKCNENGIVTGSICCNNNAPLSAVAKYPIEVMVGPEFVTGSTRMKSGTAQKMVLNMITTSAMIKLGRVEDNRMTNMQLTNDKLVDRGVKMVMLKLGWTDYEKAKLELMKYNSIKDAIAANS